MIKNYYERPIFRLYKKLIEIKDRNFARKAEMFDEIRFVKTYKTERNVSFRYYCNFIKKSSAFKIQEDACQCGRDCKIDSHTSFGRIFE